MCIYVVSAEYMSTGEMALIQHHCPWMLYFFGGSEIYAKIRAAYVVIGIFQSPRMGNSIIC